MISVKTKAHIGSNGTLMVEVPTPLRETDVEVMLVLQTLPADPASTDQAMPESRGWPPGFFDQTFGSLKDDPIERGPQGEYEVKARYWKCRYILA